MPAQRPVKTPVSARAKALAYGNVPRKTVADDPRQFMKLPWEYRYLLEPDENGRTKFSGPLQMNLLYRIMDMTIGTNLGTATNIERPEYTPPRFSHAQFAEVCGAYPADVKKVLDDAEERELITSLDRKGCGPTTIKQYKPTPEKWKNARHYEPPAKPKKEPAAESAEIEAETPREATVEPGKVSKPQTIPISPAEGAPDVNIRIRFWSDNYPSPVALSARPGRNGLLDIYFKVPTVKRFAPSSPSETPLTIDQQRFNEFADFLTPFVLDVWHKEADQPLIKSIVSAAGNAPLSVFQNIVSQKFPKREKRHHTTGLLIELAHEAERAHIAQEKRIQSHNAPNTPNAESDARRKADADASFDEAMRKIKAATA